MKLLLDSHVLIWTMDDPGRLSPAAATAIRDPANELRLSAACVAEIAIKVGLKKLTLTLTFQQWMDRAFLDLGLVLLPITVGYGAELIGLPLHHRDPFDRIQAAQALRDSLAIASADAVFDTYGVPRVW